MTYRCLACEAVLEREALYTDRGFLECPSRGCPPGSIARVEPPAPLEPTPALELTRELEAYLERILDAAPRYYWRNNRRLRPAA